MSSYTSPAYPPPHRTSSGGAGHLMIEVGHGNGRPCPFLCMIQLSVLPGIYCVIQGHLVLGHVVIELYRYQAKHTIQQIN